MSLIIPAIPFRQRKTQMYIAVVPISALDNFSVDVWKPQSVWVAEDTREDPRKAACGASPSISKGPTQLCLSQVF